jgi:integrase
MPKLARELGALEVKRLADQPGLHFVGGVHGLALSVSGVGARSWILRLVVGGRRREMGLGPFPEVTLAKARDKAREARELVRSGVDPVQRQQAAANALRAAAAAAMSFDDCAAAYIKAHEAGWRNAKHAQQWRNTLASYATPVIGSLAVREVALGHVMRILEPIWADKNETASRLRNRIELVLDWAAARGLREGPNPARWRGHLDKLLPRPAKVNRREAQPALPIDRVAAFMQQLRRQDGQSARALEFLVLTAVRSGEAREAQWSEIDLEGRVWTIPATRTKAGREHRVPLSDAALELLKALPRKNGSDLVFAAPKGGPLSDMALTQCIRRLNQAAEKPWTDPRSGREVVPHGFRSTFRDWAAERTSYPNEVAEMALAHAIDNKVEAAYRRGDLFDKRRQLMADWSVFLENTSPA